VSVSLLRRMFGARPNGGPSRQPSPRDERLGIRAGETLLYVLEERRNQLAQKATVSVAAASGIIVVCLQFVLSSVDATTLSRGLALVAVLAAALSLVHALNVIRALGRRQISRRSRTHLFYFGTITKLGTAGTEARLTSMSEREYIRELSIQADSLSRNLRERYQALKSTYRLITIAVVLLSLAIVTQEVSVAVNSQYSNPTLTTPSSSLPTRIPADETDSNETGLP